MGQITESKRRELFEHWTESQSIRGVAAKSGVSRNTVKRYRLLDRWDERLKKIEVDVAAVLDVKLVETKAEQRTRHLNSLEYILKRGISELRTRKFQNAEGAARAITQAIAAIQTIHSMTEGMTEKPKLIRMPLAPPPLPLPAPDEAEPVDAEFVETDAATVDAQSTEQNAEPAEAPAASTVEAEALEPESETIEVEAATEAPADTGPSIFDDDDFLTKPPRRRDIPRDAAEAPRQIVQRSDKPGITGSASVLNF